MKKQLIALAAALIMGAAAAGAKAFDPLFKEFKGVENVESVNVPSWMMKIARKCGDVKDEPALKHIDSMRVLSLEGKSNSANRGRLARRIDALSGDLEEALAVRDGKDNVKIWFETDGKDIIRTVYILAEDKDDMVLTEFNGHFTRNDINSLIRQAAK